MTDAEAWLELADIYLENLKYIIIFQLKFQYS